MVIKFVRFNKYLFLVLALVLATFACHTSSGGKKKKIVSMIELHIEENSDGASDSETVSISRDPAIVVNVEKEFFLDGVDLESASVINDLGGFKLQLKFNWRGTQILESITASNRGKRIAVLCGFGPVRWLAAPMINSQINDGVFSFTPDASREEAERIVKGLNEVVAKLKKDDKL